MGLWPAEQTLPALFARNLHTPFPWETGTLQVLVHIFW